MIELKIKILNNKIYAPVLGEWLTLTQEEKLKQEFIIRLINHFGYKLDQIGQDVYIKDRYRADIVIWKNSIEKKKNKIPSIIIAAECKAEHVSIKEEEYLIGYNFASSVKANFFIALNLKETKIFHVLNEVSQRKLERLKEIPRASLISDDLKLEKFISETKTFTRDEFTRLLSKCHNIIRNNDKLSPEAAFDEISKVLFMKIMYERKSKEEMIFSKEKFKADEKNYEERIRPSLKQSGSIFFDKEYMQYLFDETKREYENDELFEPGDRIRIKQRSFEMIVEELEAFNLSDTSDDVKGIAFEEFLGRTFRGELGQFFTPRTIVEYMVEVLDPVEGELICDPCCGSGGFLIKAYDYLREKIEKDVQDQIHLIENQMKEINATPLVKKSEDDVSHSWKLDFNNEFELSNEAGRLYDLSHNCIFGVDANIRMARTAKMNMIMHGDGHGGVHHHDGLLNINGIFENRFDLILTNPPFGSRVDSSLKITSSDIPTPEKVKYYESKYNNYRDNVINPLIYWAQFDNGPNKPKGKSLIDLFEVGKWSGLTEILFLERCLNLLKPGGRMGIVLPEGVLNNTALQKVRDFIESRAKIINITSIPQDVFIASGATVKPSLLFLKKFTEMEMLNYSQISEKVKQSVLLKYESDSFKLKMESKILKQSITSAQENDLKIQVKNAQKNIEEKIDNDIRMLIKAEFDYEVPIIEVQNAGISSTGAPSENELIGALKEFKSYRLQNPLWETHGVSFEYKIDGHGKIIKSKKV